jgi:hypothetical protein
MAVPSVGHAAAGDVADDDAEEPLHDLPFEREESLRRVVGVRQLDPQRDDPRAHQ